MEKSWKTCFARNISVSRSSISCSGPLRSVMTFCFVFSTLPVAKLSMYRVLTTQHFDNTIQISVRTSNHPVSSIKIWSLHGEKGTTPIDEDVLGLRFFTVQNRFRIEIVTTFIKIALFLEYSLFPRLDYFMLSTGDSHPRTHKRGFSLCKVLYLISLAEHFCPPQTTLAHRILFVCCMYKVWNRVHDPLLLMRSTRAASTTGIREVTMSTSSMRLLPLQRQMRVVIATQRKLRHKHDVSIEQQPTSPCLSLAKLPPWTF